RRIQERADELELGVQILFVGLQDIHPPVKVADAYEAVVGSIQDKEAKILTAEGYRAKEVPLAYAHATQKTNEALAYRARKVYVTEGQAAQFTNQMIAFGAS